MFWGFLSLPSSAGRMKINLCYKSRDLQALWVDFVTFGVKLTQEIAINKKTQLHIMERWSTGPRNNISVLKEISKNVSLNSILCEYGKKINTGLWFWGDKFSLQVFAIHCISNFSSRATVQWKGAVGVGRYCSIPREAQVFLSLSIIFSHYGAYASCLLVLTQEVLPPDSSTDVPILGT